jgi:hypothetical protein
MKQKGYTKSLMILLGLAMVLGMAACSSSEPAGADVPVTTTPPTSDETQKKEQDSSKDKEENTNAETQLPFVNPLSGLPAAEDTGTIRPIVVTIENSRPANPQAGLIKSDIVYELMVEGGITRFLAVFHSGLQEETVLGPIRSARHDFYELTKELDAVLVHSGASQKAYALIQSGKVKDIDEITMGGPFYRSKERKAPHNLYAGIRNLKDFSIRRGHKDDVQLQPLLFFAEKEEGLSGNPANSVKVSYHSKYNVSYQYDEQSQSYQRFMRDKPHVDQTTGQQLTVDNIVIQLTKYRSIDKEDRQEIDIIGEGKGFMIQNGQYIPIIWKKTSAAKRTVLFTLDGEEVQFKPGKTFWQIVPDSGSKIEWETLK